MVLPFTNIGGDPEQDYFVDGVTESLTTDLSRIGGSFVIARNTAFTFKGKALDKPTLQNRSASERQRSVRRAGTRCLSSALRLAGPTASRECGPKNVPQIFQTSISRVGPDFVGAHMR